MDFSETGLPIELKRVRGQRSLRIRVYSNQNRILVTAPYLASQKIIRQFVFSQLVWIKDQFRPINFENDNLTTALWGRSYRLRFQESLYSSGFDLDPQTITLRGPVSKLCDPCDRLKWLNRFYLEQIKKEATPLVIKWRQAMSVPVRTLHFRRMNSRWGSCSPQSGRVCLNTELAKYSREALEYVVVHELSHFFVANHGPSFRACLDQYLPHWRTWKGLLDTSDPLT